VASVTRLAALSSLGRAAADTESFAGEALSFWAGKDFTAGARLRHGGIAA